MVISKPDLTFYNLKTTLFKTACMKTVTFRGGFFKPANASLLFTRKVTFRVEKSDDRKYVCVRRLGFFSRDTLIRDQNSQK